jgi:hypothetical protein
MMTSQKEVKVDEEIKNKRSNSMMSSMDSLAKIRFGESIIWTNLISRVEKNIPLSSLAAERLLNLYVIFTKKKKAYKIYVSHFNLLLWYCLAK